MTRINKRQVALFYSAITEFMVSPSGVRDSNPFDLLSSIQDTDLMEAFCLDPSETSIFYKYLTMLCETDDVAYALGYADPSLVDAFISDKEVVCEIIQTKIKEFGEIYVSIALQQETVSDCIYFFIGERLKE